MRIPPDQVIIPPDKISRYLLAHRLEDDKSGWLARGGFTRDNPDELEAAIRAMLQNHDAVHDRASIYGEFYRVEGDLIGANKQALPAISIWIVDAAQDEPIYRFVTLKPGKEARA